MTYLELEAIAKANGFDIIIGRGMAGLNHALEVKMGARNLVGPDVADAIGLNQEYPNTYAGIMQARADTKTLEQILETRWANDMERKDYYGI